MFKKIVTLVLSVMMVASITAIPVSAASPASPFDMTVGSAENNYAKGEKTDGSMVADFKLSKNSAKVTINVGVGDWSGVPCTNNRNVSSTGVLYNLKYKSARDAKNEWKLLGIRNNSAYSTNVAGTFWA